MGVKKNQAPVGIIINSNQSKTGTTISYIPKTKEQSMEHQNRTDSIDVSARKHQKIKSVITKP